MLTSLWDGADTIIAKELRLLGQNSNEGKLRAMMNEVSANGNGTIDIPAYLSLISRRMKDPTSGLPPAHLQAGPLYEGCYANEDGPNRKNGHVPGKTIAQCNQMAKANGDPYFGMEYPSGETVPGQAACVTLDKFPRMPVANEDDCKYKGLVDDYYRLGGRYRLAVYRTAKAMPTAEDLKGKPADESEKESACDINLEKGCMDFIKLIDQWGVVAFFTIWNCDSVTKDKQGFPGFERECEPCVDKLQAYCASRQSGPHATVGIKHDGNYKYVADPFEYRPIPWVDPIESPFKVEQCDSIKNDAGKDLPGSIKQVFEAEGKTRCIQVYDVMIAAGAQVDTTSMQYAANILAQLLDLDCDGKVDNSEMVKEYLSFFEKPTAKTGWLAMGVDEQSERSHGLGAGAFGSMLWKSYGRGNDYRPQNLLEETFHMIHDRGWANVYPDYVGARPWGSSDQSVACMCMQEAQCKWYQMPLNGGCTDSDGNNCTDGEQLGDVVQAADKVVAQNVPGTCSYGGCNWPTCDCMEFVHKVMTAWIGNKFRGFDRMSRALEEDPKLNQRQAVEKLLSQTKSCRRLLEILNDKNVALPKRHIKETYKCKEPR